MVASRVFKVFSIAVIVAFLVSSVEPKGDMKCPESSETQSDGDMDRYIVMLESDTTVQDHYDMMTTCYKKEIKKVKPNKPNGESSVKMNHDTLMDFSAGELKGYSGMFTSSFVKSLAKMNGVSYVEKERKVRINYAIPQNFTLYRREVDDSPTPNDDRIDQAKFPLNGEYEFPDSAGEGVNIFVIDTGIRTTHNEFEDRAKVGGSFCDGCNDDDENGHGTHVASIAGGKTLGVARKANLIAIRVLDAKGAGSNVDVINGMSFVVQEHEKSDNKNSVVNMSLGGGFSQAVNDAVVKLTDAGVHVVVAAGNEAEDACKSSPASELSAITVGATELDSDDITDFSNRGKCVDIFAPGRDIQGAGIENDNAKAVFSGTSQASPHVAGTVALLIAEDGNETPEDMAKKLEDLSTKGVVKGREDGDPDSFLRTPAP